MTFADKLMQIAENMPKVYEAGQKKEYDRFWDAFQKNGGTVNGTYMLAGHGWTDKIYAPKYPIKLSAGTGLFAFSDITDTKVEIDFTNTSGSDTHVFNWGQSFTKIQMLKVNENTSYSNWFSYCINLEEIRFEGVIGKSLDIHWSTRLSTKSAFSIMKALKTSGGIGSMTDVTLTLPMSVKTYVETDSGCSILLMTAQNAGWTISFI